MRWPLPELTWAPLGRSPRLLKHLLCWSPATRAQHRLLEERLAWLTAQLALLVVLALLLPLAPVAMLAPLMPQLLLTLPLQLLTLLPRWLAH